MSIVRDIGLVVQGSEEFIIVTCSTQQNVLVTTVNQVQSSNAYMGGFGSISLVSSANWGAGIAGRIIDRLNEPFITERYTVAMPMAYLYSTRGSTETNRQLAIAVKLQHGNSSGGGDMADYSTGSTPGDVILFTTAQTTPMVNWTTGTIRSASAQASYDLRAANRYIRNVISTFKNKVTTESSGDESYHVGSAIALLGGPNVPQNAWTSVGSTSTSTST